VGRQLDRARGDWIVYAAASGRASRIFRIRADGSGRAPIARVEVSTDAGETWADAELTRDLEGPWAWCGWTASWDALPGEHVLCCRATDETGEAQPLEPEWNVGGYENNAVQRVRVKVD